MQVKAIWDYQAEMWAQQFCPKAKTGCTPHNCISCPIYQAAHSRIRVSGGFQCREGGTACPPST